MCNEQKSVHISPAGFGRRGDGLPHHLRKKPVHAVKAPKKLKPFYYVDEVLQGRGGGAEFQSEEAAEFQSEEEAEEEEHHGRFFARQVKWRHHQELKAAFVAERKQRAAEREARRVRSEADEANARRHTGKPKSLAIVPEN